MLRVGAEVGAKRTFATALDWPGWSRSARHGRDGDGVDAAVAALSEYRPRYVAVLEAAGLAPPPDDDVQVVEVAAGNATTDFGAPGVVLDAEREPLDAAEAQRRAAVVAACWAALDAVARTAPAELRKGPRGGGRDRDAVVTHVLAAEASYARQVGHRAPAPQVDDRTAIEASRAALLIALRDPEAPVQTWPLRYAAARIAWHVLDHAWEIEDKSA